MSDSDAQFKVMWMSSACGTYGVEEKCDLVGKRMDRKHRGDQSVDGRIIYK
jgi:hypothetical protein